ncbi:transcription-repair coupling factor [Chlamydiifrater phoenicopteri]|uniref:transcription-repair coupling factor n=1 Tax=Chlamydiifrater phoenicopteri TaxID=2681469 RepID=UPI001BCF5C4E|nr:transcription-repair coupling factor [Chlamydiifrater phoenicopteri]
MDLNPKQINTPFFSHCQEDFKEGKSLVIENIGSGAVAFLTTKLFYDRRDSIVVVTTQQRFDDLLGNIETFLGQPPEEFPSSEIDLSLKWVNVDAVGKRDSLLHTLSEKNSPTFCLTTLKAILEKTPTPKESASRYITLSINDEISSETVIDLLKELGYQHSSLAIEKGEFAFRGGIVDIFPLSSTEPVRLEFWGETLSSIRIYDPKSQLSTGKISNVNITPANDFSRENFSGALTDYFDSQSLYVFDEIMELESDYANQVGVFRTHKKQFLAIDELWNNIASNPKLFLSSQVLSQETLNKSSIEILASTFSIKRVASPFLKIDQEFISSEENTNALASYAKYLEDFVPSLQEGLSPSICVYGAKGKTLTESATLLQASAQKFSVCTREGTLSSGFFFPEGGFAAISLSEFSHKKILRRQKQRSYFSSSTEEVYVPLPGDTVVHLQNGIGKFLGVERKPNHQNVETDYMVIEYANKAKLYVPSDQAFLISKYVGSSEKSPDLHDLNSSKWKRCRDLTEKSLIAYAEKLLKLEAERTTLPAFIYPPNGENVRKFEESFPYEETPDQLKAIDSIYSDMLSDKVMDRLICGDAGFGKTEVLMRAAVKAVCDGGKQVIVMVPTTILALQHYETFCQRMSDLPIKIGVLCRFSGTKNTRQLLNQVGAGEIDILIGTHRVIGKDVSFKNPGLLIIDEEQRFGVKVKEHLKQLHPDIDCLTISATPIPRTLYMSLSGARDLSVITVPPYDRLPVSSFVVEKKDETIQAAIKHELLRGGQAYVIHNRIETIFSLAENIRTLIPEAKISVAHGQMNSEELTKIFENFKAGTTNVLVATALIENGIDIPNANTILIDNADKFGMADLYQMKGRVGRWNKKAYCYFMVANAEILSSRAAKRLEALNKQEYGGGMKIALEDLEIRGAGNILGTDQSGHITSIGFNLYCKLLKKAVKNLKKNKTQGIFGDDVKIEFPYNSSIPESYVPSATIRIEFYQKIGNAETDEDLDEIKEELRDRFGPYDTSIELLFVLAKIRLFAVKNNFSIIKATSNTLFVVQKHGKSEEIRKTLPFSLSPDPEELFSDVVKAIGMAFPLESSLSEEASSS